MSQLLHIWLGTKSCTFDVAFSDMDSMPLLPHDVGKNCLNHFGEILELVARGSAAANECAKLLIVVLVGHKGRSWSREFLPTAPRHTSSSKLGIQAHQGDPVIGVT